jgi:mono/diheme cytochrome c family protein
MNARSSFILSSFALAFGLAVAACGGGDSGSSSSGTSTTGSTGGDTSSSSGSGSAAGDVAAGKTFATDKGCSGCHSPDFSGGMAAFMGVYPSNITPDMTTGIGGWTDDQIKMAVKTGKNNKGGQLCASMPKLADATDKQLTDLVAFLRSLSAVNKATKAGTCK